MKALILVGAFAILVSGSALACRGTTEFPEAFQQLENSSLPSGEAMILKEQLTAAQALHDEGHHHGNDMKISEAIRILDAIKIKIGE